jgi:hypothetical protein
VVTETDEVAAALDAAAAHWPAERSRAALLRRLALEGARVLRTEDERLRDERRAAVAATAGALTGAWEPGELDRLRGEWPA